MSRLKHEQIFRGAEAMHKLAKTKILVCGAGALGSNLVLNLAKAGFRQISVIDRDRVEEHNVGTQVYCLDDVGGQKAELLRNIVYREIQEEIEAHAEELNSRNINKRLKDQDLIIDAFDNTASRGLIYDFCRENKVDCMHIGVNESYGEIRWNESYRVPQEGGLDLCDYPLARNLIMLVVAVAAELIVRFVLDTGKENYSITLGDLQINRELD